MSEIAARMMAKDEDALRRICRILENDVEPDAQNVRNVVVFPQGREEQVIPLGDGLECSVKVLKEIACGYGFGGKVEPDVLARGIFCLDKFMDSIRNLDYYQPLKKKG